MAEAEAKAKAIHHIEVSHGEDPAPKKAKKDFRNYINSNRQEIVKNHYKLMRIHQSFAFVEKMEGKYLQFKHDKMTVRECFEALKGYVDSADPDTALPNLEHNLQTAEAIRAAGHPDWLVFTGLIHDMGKIMFKWGTKEDGQEGTATGDQFALGGDTWVVGCAIPDDAVFSEFNKLNPDYSNPKYNTKLGIYKEKQGLKDLKFVWGHDEYLYQMLRHNKCTIPEEGYAIVRYHSCYPLHQHDAYTHFYADGDKELIDWVLEFNKYDLYTKADERPDIEKLWPYYQTLVDKFLPGKLDW